MDLGSKNNHLSPVIIIALLLLISILYRLPFWFVDVINWDESTFLIMGQSLLKGYLPYTDYWDNKPPFSFIFVSAFIYIFGEYILSIRILGAVSVFSCSVFVYFISNYIQTSKRVSFFSAVLTIPIMSLYWQGQSTFTEHIAIPFILASLYITIRKTKLSFYDSIFIGLLISIAGLIRLNLAYMAIPVGIVLLVYTDGKQIWKRVANGLAYAVSGLTPVIILALIYYHNENLSLLFNSFIKTPFSYSTQQTSIINSFIVFSYQLIKPEGFTYLSFKNLVFLFACAGGVVELYFLTKYKNDKQVKLFVFSFALLFSVCASGATHSHYLIQLAPFLILYMSLFLHRTECYPFVQLCSITSLILLLFVGSTSVISEYHKAFRSIQKEENILYGDGYKIKNKIDNFNLCEYSLYAMSRHVTYFLLDKKPPTPLVTHPSNIAKDYVIKPMYGRDASSLSEFKKIIDKEPTIIVKRRLVWYLKEKPILKAEIKKFLKSYLLADKVGSLHIYIRKDALEGERPC